MSETMIEAKALTKRYGGARATENVSFTVRKGEVVGFLGPNGAGKTTTMKILTCFIAPTEGTAVVNGSDIFEDSLGVRRSIGYLPESTPLYVEMLVAEYLEFVARMRGLKDAEAQTRIKRAVESTGLQDVYGKEIRALSKGYKQRVGIAQALVHEPPILILDEPMSGLDPNQAVEIRELIRNIGRERTVILSTHNLAEVQATCSRVLIISKGKLVADAQTGELTKQAGQNKFLLTVLSDGLNIETLKARLLKIADVESVSLQQAPQASEVVFEIKPSSDRDLRADLSKAVGETGAVLIGLKREEQNLEEVFRQLTMGATTEGTSSKIPSTPSQDTARSTSEDKPSEGGS